MMAKRLGMVARAYPVDVAGDDLETPLTGGWVTSGIVRAGRQ